MKHDIINKLNEIHQILNQQDRAENSLYSGTGGRLLFLYEYGKLLESEEINTEFEHALHEFVDGFQDTGSTSFCNGLMGNIWLLEYLKKENVLNDLLLDIKDELNESYLKWGEQYALTKNFDFLHGLIGFLFVGNYCPVFKKENVAQLANEMLMALKTEGELSYLTDWLPTPENKAGSERVNIGLAHGISSAIIALSHLSTSNSQYKKHALAIAQFIYHYGKRKNEQASLYTEILINKNQHEFDSRLAWCYGDLGIASAFWQVGKVSGQDFFEKEAVHIMKHNSLRRDSRENFVHDCGLCHGSAGISHIYRRFWWETGEPVFKETADYWTLQTLNMANHKNGLAGYLSYCPMEDEKWKENYGLLEGIAGIGLSLIGAVSQKPTNWDQCMMLS